MAGFQTLLATDAPLLFSVAPAQAALEAGFQFSDSLGVWLTDSAAQIEALSADQLNQLSAAGVTGLKSNSGEIDIAMTVALAALGGPVALSAAGGGARRSRCRHRDADRRSA